MPSRARPSEPQPGSSDLTPDELRSLGAELDEATKPGTAGLAALARLLARVAAAEQQDAAGVPAHAAVTPPPKSSGTSFQ